MTIIVNGGELGTGWLIAIGAVALFLLMVVLLFMGVVWQAASQAIDWFERENRKYRAADEHHREPESARWFVVLESPHCVLSPVASVCTLDCVQPGDVSLTAGIACNTPTLPLSARKYGVNALHTTAATLRQHLCNSLAQVSRYNAIREARMA